MFDNNGPVHARGAIIRVLPMVQPLMPAEYYSRMDDLIDAVSPVDVCVKGMEHLWAVVRETENVPEPVVQALGVAATAVREGHFHGKYQRANAIAAWAAWKVTGLGDEPEAPAVDPDYTLVQPETPAEPPVPA